LTPATVNTKVPEVRVPAAVVEVDTVIVAELLTAGLLVDVALIVMVAAVEGAV